MKAVIDIGHIAQLGKNHYGALLTWFAGALTVICNLQWDQLGWYEAGSLEGAAAAAADNRMINLEEMQTGNCDGKMDDGGMRRVC